MNGHQIRRELLISSLKQYIIDDVLNIICEYASPISHKEEVARKIDKRYDVLLRKANDKDLEDYFWTYEYNHTNRDKVYSQHDKEHNKFYFMYDLFQNSHNSCSNKKKLWFVRLDPG